jgi:hypothetical protein
LPTVFLLRGNITKFINIWHNNNIPHVQLSRLHGRFGAEYLIYSLKISCTGSKKHGNAHRPAICVPRARIDPLQKFHSKPGLHQCRQSHSMRTFIAKRRSCAASADNRRPVFDNACRDDDSDAPQYRDYICKNLGSGYNPRPSKKLTKGANRVSFRIEE